MFTKHLPKLTKLGFAVSVGLVSNQLSAATLDQIRQAIRAERYEQAYPSLETLAKNNDREAQYLLGTLYFEGRGRLRDETRAFEWCMRAAEAGLPAAQLQVGLMYLEGHGVTANDDAAMDWIWKAANAGNERATALLDYVLYNDFTYGC